MSNNSLRKIPTEWLDSIDKRSGEAVSPSGSGIIRRVHSKGKGGNEWETIIDISSGENCGEGGCRPEFGKCEGRAEQRRGVCGCRNNGSVIAGRDGDEGDDSSTESGFGVQICGKEYRLFGGLTFLDVGSGRIIGTRALLLMRVIFLFVYGVSVGFSYASGEELPLKVVLSQTFVWVHVGLVLVIPFLLLSSLVTLRWRSCVSPEDSGPRKQKIWVISSVCFQVLSSLAQTEVVRLFVLRVIPSLRPRWGYADAEPIFSLTSAFSRQIYILAGTCVLEVVFSRNPHRLENVLVTVVVSSLLETIALLIQPVEQNAGVKIAIGVCNAIVVALVSIANFGVYKGLQACCASGADLSDDEKAKPRIIV